jgi:hypothetical protein
MKINRVNNLDKKWNKIKIEKEEKRFNGKLNDIFCINIII